MGWICIDCGTDNAPRHVNCDVCGHERTAAELRAYRVKRVAQWATGFEVRLPRVLRIVSIAALAAGVLLCCAQLAVTVKEGVALDLMGTRLQAVGGNVAHLGVSARAPADTLARLFRDPPGLSFRLRGVGWDNLVTHLGVLPDRLGGAVHALQGGASLAAQHVGSLVTRILQGGR